MPFDDNSCLMSDINQLRHLDKVFPFNIKSAALGSSNCHIWKPCLSNLSILKESAGICQISDDRPIISLSPPCSRCEENLDIVGGIFGQHLLRLVYASVRNHTSCPAPCVNHICTP